MYWKEWETLFDLSYPIFIFLFGLSFKRDLCSMNFSLQVRFNKGGFSVVMETRLH